MLVFIENHNKTYKYLCVKSKGFLTENCWMIAIFIQLFVVN